MDEFPPVRDLVPHAGPMVLLDAVIAHDAESTTCSIEIAAQELFREPDGSVRVWIGIEYMAQCIAVHAGLVRRAEGNFEQPRGFLVGARALRFHVDRFRDGQRLLATARRRWAGASTLASFDCALQDAESGHVLAEGRLNCFVPRAEAG